MLLETMTGRLCTTFCYLCLLVSYCHVYFQICAKKSYLQDFYVLYVSRYPSHGSPSTESAISQILSPTLWGHVLAMPCSLCSKKAFRNERPLLYKYTSTNKFSDKRIIHNTAVIRNFLKKLQEIQHSLCFTIHLAICRYFLQ